jgi:hypothetical protein
MSYGRNTKLRSVHSKGRPIRRPALILMYVKNRIPIFVFVVAIVVLGAFFLMEQRAVVPISSSQAAPRTFSWRFDTTESDDGLLPRTHVALITNGDVYNAGMYAGHCSEILSENLLQNEISGVLCWWAGAGDELGVFREGDQYILKRGTQEEPTAESEGFRGDFQQIAVIQ